jgi:hypothetical protein
LAPFGVQPYHPLNDGPAVDSECDDYRRPPTVDDLAAGFAIASRDIGPAIQRAEVEYGQTALIGAFVMLGDILTAFGATEEQLVELARQSTRIQLEPTY